MDARPAAPQHVAGFSRLWHPHARVQGAAQLRRARVAAGLLLALLALAFLDLAATWAGAYGPPTADGVAVGAGATVIVAASYALVRGGFVTPGVVLARRASA